jgi:uncharacterized membrane protein YvbJ
MKNNLENKTEFTEREIEQVLETQVFKQVYVPAFKFPETVKSIQSPYSWYKSYIKIAGPILAMPVFIFIFSFFLNDSASPNTQSLAMLEASNQKLLEEIKTLDDESLEK